MKQIAINIAFAIFRFKFTIKFTTRTIIYHLLYNEVNYDANAPESKQLDAPDSWKVSTTQATQEWKCASDVTELYLSSHESSHKPFESESIHKKCRVIDLQTRIK